MRYAARTHSEGIGCARWSATSFLRRACSSALIEAGSSRNSGPMAIAFLAAGRSPAGFAPAAARLHPEDRGRDAGALVFECRFAGAAANSVEQKVSDL
jgi:hypothetical protein